MSTKLKLLGISGSLRRNSYNSAALRACRALVPAVVEIKIYEGLGELPHYNEDVEREGFPAVVEDLRRRIREADALLIATPEYNHSIPGVLKNAIDWASRKPDIPLTKKSVAIMGAATGPAGTLRAQGHLRDVMVFFDATVVNKPEVFIRQAATKFDAEGNLTDEGTAASLRTLLDALFRQTVRQRAGLNAAA